MRLWNRNNSSRAFETPAFLRQTLGNQTLNIDVQVTGNVNFVIYRPALVRPSLTNSASAKRGYSFEQYLVSAATDSILSAILGG